MAANHPGAVNFDNKIISANNTSAKSIRFEKLLNHLFNRFRLRVKVHPLLNASADMVSEYQRINFYHLMNRVLDSNIEGDIVELGCFEGQTALLFQQILVNYKAEKRFVVFDNFRHDFGLNTDIKSRLIENFKNKNLPLPEIADGDFKDTLKNNLPEKIAFLHIDCGFGGDKYLHKEVILNCLNQTYNRMAAGAVCVLMDYHVDGITLNGTNCNPGVKLACDEFFNDRPEKVYTLYGGQYSHGYFIKGKLNP